MDWIVALLALAGVMAVLSTITSVITESFHKVLSLRSGGLKRMMFALYEDGFLDAGAARVPEALRSESREQRKQRTAAAKAFADAMTRIPTKHRGFVERIASRLPVIRLFARRYNSLSKIEFVEQFAGTQEGQALLDRDRSHIERELGVLAYQLDRYGSAQSSIFGMRAKFISSMAALGFVIAANVNALSIYQHLASSDDAVSAALAGLGVSTEQTNPVAELQATLDSVQTSLDEGNFNTENVQSFETQLASVGGQLDGLRAVGIPIGRDFFPYCKQPAFSGAQDFLAGQIDPLCQAMADENTNRSVLSRIFLTQHGFLWIGSMIGTAGLLGLGAPFWFNIFASLSPVGGGALSRLGRRQTAAATVETAGRPQAESQLSRSNLARPGNEPALDVLHDGFKLAAGRTLDTRLARDIAEDRARHAPVMPVGEVYPKTDVIIPDPFDDPVASRTHSGPMRQRIVRGKPRIKTPPGSES
ncbi:MAG: hypothetical protein AAF216_06785 [Pseudomonadota bacterium]